MMPPYAQDWLVVCFSCERTTSHQEDPQPMCPRCGGFQRIVTPGE